MLVALAENNYKRIRKNAATNLKTPSKSKIVKLVSDFSNSDLSFKSENEAPLRILRRAILKSEKDKKWNLKREI